MLPRKYLSLTSTVSGVCLASGEFLHFNLKLFDGKNLLQFTNCMEMPGEWGYKASDFHY